MFYNELTKSGWRLEGVHMDYEREIISMVKQIHSGAFLKMIYRYVYRLVLKSS